MIQLYGHSRHEVIILDILRREYGQIQDSSTHMIHIKNNQLNSNRGT